ERRGGVALEVRASFRRRPHQRRRPPLAKIRPGGPAPATGPGTAGATPLTTSAIVTSGNTPATGGGPGLSSVALNRKTPATEPKMGAVARTSSVQMVELEVQLSSNDAPNGK